MRVCYKTAFLGEIALRCGVGSHVEGQRVSINSNLMCQPPNFVDIDVPISQDQLNGNEGEISDVELKVVRSKIGVKSISVTIEPQRDAYEGPLEQLAANFMQTALTTSSSAQWAGSIMG